VDRPGDDRFQVAPGLEDDPGRPYELGDDDPLRAVDDKGAAVRHHGEVPHENRLLFNLTGVGVLELRAHEYRRRIGHVFFFALFDRELRRRPQVLVTRVELQNELK
jgi:hypothetical protein